MKQDPKSQARVYELYHPALRGYIMNRYKNADALDDILSKTFERAFKKIDKYTFRGSFNGWLQSIINHKIYDYINGAKKGSDVIMFVDDVNDHDFGADKVVFSHSHVNDGEVTVQMENHMSIIANTLSKREYEVFMMFYEGYGHREISNILSIKEGTSKWYLNAAREKLKNKISKQSLLN